MLYVFISYLSVVLKRVLRLSQLSVGCGDDDDDDV